MSSPQSNQGATRPQRVLVLRAESRRRRVSPRSVTLKREDKKAAIAAYRERKADAGVYVVRCAASGEQWVGSAPDLRTIWNRVSFSLRQGAGQPPSLQRAWTAHGAGSFAFEIVERLDAEDPGYDGARTLRDRLNHWRGVLAAEPI